MKERPSGISRRKFLETAAATGAAFTIVPRHVLGKGFTPPSDLLNIACVGIGGMGRNNMRAVGSQNVVAVCDVDWDYAGKSIERYSTDLQQRRNPPAAGQGRARQGDESHDPARAGEPIEDLQRLVDQLPKAKRYSDYREMLSNQKDIDAVMVATPDHMHAPIALAAMDLGKHVYVQKPLCWSVDEARHLARKARENKKIATQMGNQGHSHSESRMTVEYIQDGAIGDVKEVHAWTNRPLGYWPQGLPRPKPMKMTNGQAPQWNGRGVEARLADAMYADYPVPDTLKWDLFLGVAPQVEYHPVYHPFNWRGWVDWGQGALGDMGAHLIDFPFWALELGMPTSVETISTPFNDVCYPNATTTYYEFAARGNKPAVKMTWYDGGLLPPRPAEFSEEMVERNGKTVYKDEVNKDGGVMFVGSKGKLMHETYGYKPRLLPQSLADSTPKPKERIARIQTPHEMNWVNAAKGTAEASSPFDYAARLVEVMLLGVVSLRARTKIYYDAEKMRITNVPSANDFLKRDYRQGFRVGSQ
ncbi:MAG TPA: Gfo/Idh/MocA family oxidoreductase [Vicinamibacterales bacterium]|nr:Gfo/Idh/MocA family oxidoreductase [Vicinamibacterales bacterium]